MHRHMLARRVVFAGATASISLAIVAPAPHAFSVPTQAPPGSTIAGTHTLTKKVTKCVGFDEGCNIEPMTLRIDCKAAGCTVRRTDEPWERAHALTLDGTTWRASGADRKVSWCNKKDRPGTLTLELRREGQRLFGTYRVTAPAVPGESNCEDAEAELELSGQAKRHSKKEGQPPESPTQPHPTLQSNFIWAGYSALPSYERTDPEKDGLVHSVSRSWQVPEVKCEQAPTEGNPTLLPSL